MLNGWLCRLGKQYTSRSGEHTNMHTDVMHMDEIQPTNTLMRAHIHARHYAHTLGRRTLVIHLEGLEEEFSDVLNCEGAIYHDRTQAGERLSVQVHTSASFPCKSNTNETRSHYFGEVKSLGKKKVVA